MQRSWLFLDNLREHRMVVGPVEWQRARKRFIENHAQAKEIGPRIEVGAACLLGAHVSRGAQGNASPRDDQRRGIYGLADAEIEKLDGRSAIVGAAQKNVRRTQIAMHHPR